jgi:hypothetical protein
MLEEMRTTENSKHKQGEWDVSLRCNRRPIQFRAAVLSVLTFWKTCGLFTKIIITKGWNPHTIFFTSKVNQSWNFEPNFASVHIIMASKMSYCVTYIFM